MQALQKDAAAKGIAWLTINSTEEDSGDYLSGAQLARWMGEQQAAPTATLMDTDGRVGRAYAARVTPHMYIVDAQGKLAYAGSVVRIASARVADIAQPTPYIRQALGEIAAGKLVSVSTSRPYSCKIKYAPARS